MYKKNQSTIAETEQNQWFQTWFNTPFYHLLYNKRNYAEAKAFISKLVQHLNPKANSLVLDLACGVGRHSITLHKLGLDVLGVDLSVTSIEKAKKSESDGLHFKVHDMREVIEIQYFDYIFNLFTSFGYFGNLHDDEKVLKACNFQLKPDGVFVLDYFNVNNILPSLPYFGKESRDDIDFMIEKTYHFNHIIKSIKFVKEGKSYHFEERVAAYLLEDFAEMFERCGFKMEAVFGNYNLEKFHNNSERIIIIASKK